jgi:hypothetical protein
MASSKRLPLIVVLALFGIVARITPHPWNATPTIALSLFAGAHLSWRWSISLPVLILASTDLILGWHNTVLFTWGAFLLMPAVAAWIRRHPSAVGVACGSVTASTLFFLVSNFGVWVAGELYPRTWAGLAQCYVAAVPFFRTHVLGDLAFAALLFGGHALVQKTLLAARPTTAR